MRISEVGNLGKIFSGGEENRGLEKKDYFIGTVCIAGAVAFWGFSKKMGSKIADGVSRVCKDCYNYFTKGKSENNSIRPNINKDTEELHELLQPIVVADRTCNDFSNVEKPKVLVDGLIYRGEKTLLFSPANSGKTIYAFQVAIETAKKYPNCKVVYFNQEMNDNQINNRLYPEGVDVPNDYYPSNLILKPSQMNSEAFVKNLLDSIPQNNGEIFVILDNITHLCPKQQSNDATDLVNKLTLIIQNAKIKRNVTVTSLIVAHTVKGHCELLSERDFNGKSTIYDLVDAAFAIGATRDENKYIVKLKQRNEKFSAKHLYIYEIKKGNQEKPYLHMELTSEAEAEVVFPSKKAKVNTSANNYQNNKKRYHQGRRWEFTEEQVSFLRELYDKSYSLRDAQKAFATRFGESPCHTHINKQYKIFQMAQIA
ncbi:MAG: AAA family ATPase [Bacteroidales bacterium]|nr:AAA family ATPase [Bacteroidales bacterium]